MKSLRKDPLLGAARVLIILIQAFVIFAMVMIGIGIGALLSVQSTEIATKIAEAGAPAGAYWLLIGALVLVIVLLALAYRFFKELAGIANSVGEGDPFQTANADRLTRMGWLSIGAHALGFVLAGLTDWFAPYLEKAGHHAEFGFDIEITGVLLTLILFILARVFKRGAEMREELEGTV